MKKQLAKEDAMKTSRLWMLALAVVAVPVLSVGAQKTAAPAVRPNVHQMDPGNIPPLAPPAAFTVSTVKCVLSHPYAATVTIKNGGGLAGVGKIQVKYTRTFCTDPNYQANWCKDHPAPAGIICVAPACADTTTTMVGTGQAQSPSVAAGQQAVVVVTGVPSNADDATVTVTPGTGASVKAQCADIIY